MRILFFLVLFALPLFSLAGCDIREKNPPAPSALAHGEKPLPAPEAPSPAAPASLSPAAPAAPSAAAAVFLHAEIAPGVVEHPAAALPHWRNFRDQRPTLLLVSNDPFLEPIPAAVAQAVRNLLDTGSDEQIVHRSSPQAPDLLLRPSMAVRAALGAGWFGKVIWLLPSRIEKENLSADAFRQQLLDFGAASESEAGSFRLVNHQLLGTIEGIPWLATPAQLFTGTPEPVVIHFDLSLIKPLYRNEIKTPLYPMLAELLEPLRQARLKALSVTLSLSQLTGEVPLDTRFIGRDLAALVAEPQRFDAPMDSQWQRRSEVLALQNFFQKEKILALYLEMAEAAPEDASVDFGLYQISRQMKNDEQSRAYLAQAVAHDPLYALEYLELAQQALHQNQPEQAAQLMDQATTGLPASPAIVLQQARLLLTLGQTKPALTKLKALRQLPWSPLYYPDLPALLDGEMAQARASEP